MFILLLVTQLIFPFVPKMGITPGDFIVGAGKKEVCVAGYSSTVRNVPSSVKNFIFSEYGISKPKLGEYEIDHLISLELGGSNSTRNLWPQSYITQPWNAHVKDRLENHLHKLVCNGSITLQEAQKEISSNWIESYKKYFTDKP